jgi:hypothetical protein
MGESHLITTFASSQEESYPSIANTSVSIPAFLNCLLNNEIVTNFQTCSSFNKRPVIKKHQVQLPYPEPYPVRKMTFSYL